VFLDLVHAHMCGALQQKHRAREKERNSFSKKDKKR